MNCGARHCILYLAIGLALASLGGCDDVLGMDDPIRPATCGNGVVDDSDEECDDGRESAACDIDCTIPECGDLLVNRTAGEQCDDGSDSTFCNVNCTVARCGDGIVNTTTGEACDDAGQSSACNADCTPAQCGDGITNIQAGEECDHAGTSATCDDNCTIAVCGDGVVNEAAGEACDDSGESPSCSATCGPVSCGDGIVNAAAGEECDDGGESASCNANCTFARCGDTVVNPLAGEECDDGGESPACDMDCTIAVCGDLRVNPAAGEVCDQGSQSPVCDNDCTSAPCGDGTINAAAGEQCDDGGESPACNVTCTFARCGDGITNTSAGEQCDDAGPSDTCDADCTIALCGDGTLNTSANEVCDEGSQTLACDADCTPVTCGDGIVNAAAGEICDEGGESPFCDSDCTVARCGDELVNITAGEECDDGGESDDCNMNCTLSQCGDGIANIQSGEQCDHAGTSASCDADCTIAVCGDSTANALAGEDCDDGNESAACNANCTAAACGDGIVNATAGEACENGGIDTTLCDADCTPVVCGDTWVNTAIGEECDDGNADDLDFCRTSCVAASCTDGLQNGGEIDWDCGGQCGPGSCFRGQTCTSNADCVAGACDAGVCRGEVEVAAGAYHTCALSELGDVRCWGENWSGQLGYGHTNLIGDNELPQTAGNVDIGGRAIQVVTGASHTCALLSTGAVRCWGNNDYGQLGYGHIDAIGDDPSESPASAGDVILGGRVVQLAAGSWHTCALLTTGAVRCWGRNHFMQDYDYESYDGGMLGYGHIENIGNNEVPASAGDVDIGGPVQQLAAGSTHTCALLTNGSVRCWGFNEYPYDSDRNGGQLGYGHTNSIGDDELPSTAGDVDIGAPVQMIAAGSHHTCAILVDGAVRCWGDNLDCQLGYLIYEGDGCYGAIGDNEPPSFGQDVDLSGIATELSLGSGYTCALLATGAVRCWGSNWNGQLGYLHPETIGDDETPASMGDVNLGGAATDIAAGENHTCAVLATGSIRCWGYNDQGQLGYGHTLNISYSLRLADQNPVSLGEEITQVMAGYYRTCTVSSTGTVRCFDANGSSVVNINATVIQLVAGRDHTCALLSSGAVRCWGSSIWGELGYGNQNSIYNPANAGDVSIGGPVIQLAAGEDHTCALLSSGAVRCWGRNWNGELGYGHGNNIGDNPGETPASAGDVNIGGPVEQLVAGEDHTCALLANGAVRCWGASWYGELGYGQWYNHIGDNETPADAGDINLGGTAIELVAGAHHTCARLATGSFRCWGGNWEGQLGYNHTNPIGDNESPASAGDIPLGNAIEQLVAGYNHTCAKMATGGVRCWGRNDYGLGYEDYDVVRSSQAGDLPIVGDVAELVSGPWHTCALMDGGTELLCWGANHAYQLGYGHNIPVGGAGLITDAGDVPWR